MRIKKLFIIILITLTLFTLTSCWGKKELDEIALVAGFAIDPNEMGYEVSIQVMVPGEIAGQAKTTATTVKLFSEEGKSIFQAVRKLTKKIPRKPYFTHLMAIIINEEIAKDNMFQVLDLLVRETEIRPNVPVFIAKDNKAKDILKVLTHIETIPANKIRKTAENMDTNWSTTPIVSVYELVNSMASDGVNPVVIGISVKGNEEIGNSIENVEQIDPAGRIELVNYGVFKDNKLIGWLNEEDGIGFNYLIGEIQSTLLSVPCDEFNTFNLEITKSRMKNKIEIKNGKPVIHLTYTAQGNIGELGCSIDLSKPEEIDKLQSIFEEEAIKNAKVTLEKLQKEFKSDIIGIGEMIHKKNPKVWKSLKEDWDSHFENLEIEVDAKFVIKRTGAIRGQLIDKLLK